MLFLYFCCPFGFCPSPYLLVYCRYLSSLKNWNFWKHADCWIVKYTISCCSVTQLIRIFFTELFIWKQRSFFNTWLVNDMNCFPGAEQNNQNFEILRHRLRSVRRGHRRHQLLLPTGSSSTSRSISVTDKVCDEYLDEDDDDGGSLISDNLDCIR